MASRMIEIGDEAFNILERPRSDTALVQEQEKQIVATGVNFQDLLNNLSEVGKLTKVAHSGVEGDAEMQTKVRRIGVNVASLGDKSALTISKLKRTIENVLSDLQTTYQYLYDGLEDVAIETLKLMAPTANRMAEEAVDLAKAYDKESENIEEVLADLAKNLEIKKKQRKSLKETERKLHFEVEKLREEVDRAERKTAKPSYIAEEIFEEEGAEPTQHSRLIDLIIIGIKFLVSVLKGEISLDDFGSMFEQEEPANDSATAKATHKEEEKKTRQLLKQHQKYAELLQQLEDSTTELVPMDTSIESLRQSTIVLKRSSKIIRNLSFFWKKLEGELKQILTQEVQKINTLVINMPAERRAKVWTSKSFMTEGMRYYAKWSALCNICMNFLGCFNGVQIELDGYLTNDNTPEEAKKLSVVLLRELVNREQV